MAKEQNLALSSAKISGNCGRLMCCLSFEQKVYEMEHETFPRVNAIVETPVGKGIVAESNFLSGKIKVKVTERDGTTQIKTYTAADVKIVGMVKTKETETNEDIED